jgi:hypothetical protein
MLIGQPIGGISLDASASFTGRPCPPQCHDLTRA